MPADHRLTESSECESHLIEKANQLYVFSSNFKAFSLNNIVKILILNVKLAKGSKQSSLFKSFRINEGILIKRQRDSGNISAHDQHKHFLLPHTHNVKVSLCPHLLIYLKPVKILSISAPATITLLKASHVFLIFKLLMSYE